ncbi:unnamed protein product [Arctogadus glacialis]
MGLVLWAPGTPGPWSSGPLVLRAPGAGHSVLCGPLVLVTVGPWYWSQGALWAPGPGGSCLRPAGEAMMLNTSDQASQFLPSLERER